MFQEVFSRTTFSSNIDKDIISLAAVQLEEFVVNCHFGGNTCNLTRDFSQFFDPYYFNCFTYTSPQSLKTEKPWSLSEGIIIFNIYILHIYTFIIYPSYLYLHTKLKKPEQSWSLSEGSSIILFRYLYVRNNQFTHNLIMSSW